MVPRYTLANKKPFGKVNLAIKKSPEPMDVVVACEQKNKHFLIRRPKNNAKSKNKLANKSLDRCYVLEKRRFCKVVLE